MSRNHSRPFPGARALLLAAGALIASHLEVSGQSLNGSPASLDLQNAQAQRHGFSILRTPQQVREFVNSGYLVPVLANADMGLHQVSFPYARPEVRVFLERLASQYRGACGEKLVVTSLTRPTSNQPPNASVRSVHPTGMAVDLRRPANNQCRQWLESTLLSLEAAGVLDATYERNPPHYHVAVFPQPYSNYLASRTENAALLIQAAQNSSAEMRVISHVVARGESLTALSSRYNVPIARIRAENGIQGDRLTVGQELRIPLYDAGAGTAADAVASVASSSPGASNAPLRAAAASTATASSATSASSATPASAAGSRSAGATASGSMGHTVSRGESLWTIARLYGLTETELRAANGISGSRIFVGQALEIPTTMDVGDTIPYRVQRGDSLWIIASRVGTTVDEIRRVNGMGSTRIYEGQLLDIPVTR